MPFHYHSASTHFNFLSKAWVQAWWGSLPLETMSLFRQEGGRKLFSVGVVGVLILDPWRRILFPLWKKADFAVKQWQKQQPPCQQNQAHFDPVLLKPDYKLRSFGKDIIREHRQKGSGFGARSTEVKILPPPQRGLHLSVLWGIWL